MLENLEKKIYESVNEKGIYGFGMIPGALILDTKKFMETENITEINEKIKNYAFASFMELRKLFGCYGLIKFISDYAKKQKIYFNQL